MDNRFRSVLQDDFKEDIVCSRSTTLSNIMYILCWIFIVLLAVYAFLGLQILMISFSLPNVLRGDILTTRWLRQQIWWLVMVVCMAFFYVSNRYYAQKQMINNNHLKEELKEMHYDAMARSSQLMRNSRRSIIVDKLMSSNSTLAMPERQPATIE